MSAFYKIWIFFKSSPFLYKLILFIRGRYQPGFFPEPTSDIHLAGYQRSGNTFAQRILRTICPELKVATHVHSTATIKLALKYNIPIVCLIRDPKDAIASSFVKNLDRGRSRFVSMISVHEYVNYYSFVRDNIDKIDVVDFKDFSVEPNVFLSAVNKYIPIDFNSIDIDAVEKTVIQDLKNDQCNGQVLSATSSNWSNPEKQKKKDLEIATLERDVNYQKAVELYVALVRD